MRPPVLAQLVRRNRPGRLRASVALDAALPCPAPVGAGADPDDFTGFSCLAPLAMASSTSSSALRRYGMLIMRPLPPPDRPGIFDNTSWVTVSVRVYSFFMSSRSSALSRPVLPCARSSTAPRVGGPSRWPGRKPGASSRTCSGYRPRSSTRPIVGSGPWPLSPPLWKTCLPRGAAADLQTGPSCAKHTRYPLKFILPPRVRGYRDCGRQHLLQYRLFTFSGISHGFLFSPPIKVALNPTSVGRHLS